MIRKISIFTIVILLLAVHGRSLGADANPDWERVVGAAKKEGKKNRHEVRQKIVPFAFVAWAQP
jgi:hypothetical protein